jgi:hypothetical protein
VTGQPHSRNLDRWESLVRDSDVLGLHRVLTGLDRDSIRASCEISLPVTVRFSASRFPRASD